MFPEPSRAAMPPHATPVVPDDPHRIIHRFSTQDYGRMIQLGILPEDNTHEFLNGLVVRKVDKTPIHSAVIGIASDAIRRGLPDGWFLRVQNPLLAQRSLPEPDVGIVRGEPFDYTESHPTGTDFALAIEVADSTLAIDRDTKRPIYARAGVPIYWIINLNARRVEVYADPTGDVADPTYRSLATFDETRAVPLVIDGRTVAEIAVKELLP